MTEDEVKDIIVNSLKYLIENKRIILFGFVIMPNHIHLIIHITENNNIKAIQRDFLKFTAQQIKFYLIKNNPQLLAKLLVNTKDRKYQIWERNPRVVEIQNNLIFEQKLNYIHLNPLQPKWHLCETPAQYKYSSALFYEIGTDCFSMITNGYNY